MHGIEHDAICHSTKEQLLLKNDLAVPTIPTGNHNVTLQECFDLMVELLELDREYRSKSTSSCTGL
jgi:hypothetical protein